MAVRPGADYSKKTDSSSRLTISASAAQQLIIVTSLLAAMLITYVVGSLALTRSPWSHTSWGNFLAGLSSNLLVAVAIFLLLERGIESLHPTAQLPDLPIEQYIRDIQHLRQSETMRVLDTYTYLESDTYYKKFESALKNCRARRIEILLMHPYSAGAIKRAEQLARDADVADELRKNLARLYKLQQTLGAGSRGLKVKLYTALPPIVAYRWGDLSYVSLLPIGTLANESPNFRVSLNDPFGRYVDHVFAELDAGSPEAPTVNLKDHMEAEIFDPKSGNHEEPDLVVHFAFEIEKTLQDVTGWRRCYVFGDNVHRVVHNASEVHIKIDGRKFRARPHYFKAGESTSEGHIILESEVQHARRLVQSRYDDEHIERIDESIWVFENLGLVQ